MLLYMKRNQLGWLVSQINRSRGYYGKIDRLVIIVRLKRVFPSNKFKDLVQAFIESK